MLSSKIFEVTGLISNTLAAIVRVRALVWAMGAAEDIRSCH